MCTVEVTVRIEILKLHQIKKIKWGLQLRNFRIFTSINALQIILDHDPHLLCALIFVIFISELRIDTFEKVA